MFQAWECAFNFLTMFFSKPRYFTVFFDDWICWRYFNFFLRYICVQIFFLFFNLIEVWRKWNCLFSGFTGWRLYFFKSLWLNADAFSWPDFQVQVIFTVKGSIASSTLKFIYYVWHKVVYLKDKRSLKRKKFERFLWFLKTIWILQQREVLLRLFWSFILVWKDNSPRIGRTNIKLFSAVNAGGFV